MHPGAQEFRREYVRLDDEFALAVQLIEARKRALLEGDL